MKAIYAYGLVFPLLGIDGEMLGYVKILRDLTERKNAEDSIKNHVQELEELNTHKKKLLQFFLMICPLSSIIATTKYLKDNFERMKPETVKKCLNLFMTRRLLN
jgi:two-component system CheB/CheR fusion protein